jgi:hypothetical protein
MKALADLSLYLSFGNEHLCAPQWLRAIISLGDVIFGTWTDLQMKSMQMKSDRCDARQGITAAELE